MSSTPTPPVGVQPTARRRALSHPDAGYAATKRRLVSVGGEEWSFLNRCDELLCAAGTGDRRAFAALFDATAPRIIALLAEIIVDDFDGTGVEALASRVYLDVWRTASSYRVSQGRALRWIEESALLAARMSI